MPSGIYERSKETKKKMSKIAKDNGFGKWMKGKKHSEETKRKIGLGNKGKFVSKETREKISKFCKNRFKNPSNHPSWKGGIRLDKDGYISLYSPYHPNNVNNFVLRSRLVMEQHLKRFLKSNEIVHHKGIKYPIGSIKNKQDDRIENLQLFSGNKEHLGFHAKLRRNV